MKLEKDESVVCAWAEPAHGPGWSNAPVWIIIRDRNGTLRQDCLQPDEQSRDMLVLYRMSALVSGQMKGAVETALCIDSQKRKGAKEKRR